MDKQEIYDAGYDRGFSIASWQDLPEIGEKLPRHIDYIGIGEIQDLNDAREAFLMLCSEAEDNNRQFTPFEFTARDLNDLDQDETLDFEPWDMFNDGISDGFYANWQSRVDYYEDTE